MESKRFFNQTYLMNIEDYSETEDVWWNKGTLHITLSLSAIYMVTIFSLQKYMKNRPAYEFRTPMVMWSGVLAIFSIIGAIRTIPERFHVLYNYGWRDSVCNGEYYTGPVAFWSLLFTLSKVYEFGDTIIIVLRKQKLTFLHWYHHVTVLIFTWHVRESKACTSLGRWFAMMNYSVHALMYSYYTLRALKIQVPRAIAMCVTILQILQVWKKKC